MFNAFGENDPIVPNLHFMFLIDIDPISKISKTYLTGLHNVPVPLFSKIVKDIGFQNFEICRNGMF